MQIITGTISEQQNKEKSNENLILPILFLSTRVLSNSWQSLY